MKTSLDKENQEGSSPEVECFEQTITSVFAELADLFGNPRSHGQVYGILFSSLKPLTMEEISNRTGISMGSVSIALRVLEEFGAVEREYLGTGKSKTGVYTARLELKTLIAGFVQHRLLPRLARSNATLKDLSSLIDQMPAGVAKDAGVRLKRVTQWHTRAAQLLPLAEKLLGGKLANSRASKDESK